MLPYWLLFLYFAAGAAMKTAPPTGEHSRTSPYLIFGGLLTTVMIGTRFNVGGDWSSYSQIFARVEHLSFERALKIGDPGYQFINWTVQQWNGEIYWVNLICGAIFMWGLCRLALAQPLPILAISVGVPYLIIVVAMGYTRQSVAIGILMAGLAALSRGSSVFRFAAYVLVAALFHKTSVLVLPLVIFAGKRNRVLNVIAGAALCALFYDLFLSDSTDQYVQSYIERKYSSQGAWIRVILNLIPAIILLRSRGKLGLGEQEEKVWRYIGIAACTLPLLLIFTPSSTAVDRMALYLIPIQIVVLSRAYMLFRNPRIGVLSIIAFALLIQFVWLNFATHARWWLPYRSWVLEDLNDNRNRSDERR